MVRATRPFLRVRDSAQSEAPGDDRGGDGGIEARVPGEWRGVTSVSRWPLPDDRELELRATGGGQGRVAARQAWLQPPTRRHRHPQDRIGARALYEDLYCARGDIENRIKEQQLDLFADRTSSDTMRANQLRAYFSAFAGVVIQIIRTFGLKATRLARAQAGTIRTQLLKIAGSIRVTTRKVWVSLSSVYPWRELFKRGRSQPGRRRAATPSTRITHPSLAFPLRLGWIHSGAMARRPLHSRFTHASRIHRPAQHPICCFPSHPDLPPGSSARQDPALSATLVTDVSGA